MVRAGVEQDLALGQLIYYLRTEAGLSQRELAEKMGTTQSIIRGSRSSGARHRTDTIARVAAPSTATSSCRSERCLRSSSMPSRWPEGSPPAERSGPARLYGDGGAGQGA